MATSKFLRTFRTIAGAPITTATIWLVPQANTYPTGALALTAHGTRDGQYYRDNVPDGEYKIYIDPAGGSSPTLYEERLWIGDQRVTTISDHFDSADSYKLKMTGLKQMMKVVVSTTNPTPDFIGQPGVDANGKKWIAIALSGTMWEEVAQVDNSTLQRSSIGVASIKDLGVTNAKIANATILPAKFGQQVVTVVSLVSPTPSYIGQPGRDSVGNNYVAIALTGTMWQKVADISNLNLIPNANFNGAVLNSASRASNERAIVWYLTDGGFAHDISMVTGSNVPQLLDEQAVKLVTLVGQRVNIYTGGLDSNYNGMITFGTSKISVGVWIYCSNWSASGLSLTNNLRTFSGTSLNPGYTYIQNGNWRFYFSNNYLTNAGHSSGYYQYLIFDNTAGSEALTFYVARTTILLAEHIFPSIYSNHFLDDLSGEEGAVTLTTLSERIDSNDSQLPYVHRNPYTDPLFEQAAVGSTIPSNWTVSYGGAGAHAAISKEIANDAVTPFGSKSIKIGMDYINSGNYADCQLFHTLNCPIEFQGKDTLSFVCYIKRENAGIGVVSSYLRFYDDYDLGGSNIGNQYSNANGGSVPTVEGVEGEWQRVSFVVNLSVGVKGFKSVNFSVRFTGESGLTGLGTKYLWFVAPMVNFRDDFTQTVFERNDLENAYNKAVEALADSGLLVPYSGLKIATYGDSITANNNWQPFLITELGCTHYLRACGGARIKNSNELSYWIGADGVYINRPTIWGGNPVNSLLTSNGTSGTNSIVVADGTKFAIGNSIFIYEASGTMNSEENSITNIVSNTLTLTNNLSNNYTTANGAGVDRFPAGGTLIDGNMCTQDRVDNVPTDTDVIIILGGANDSTSDGSMADSAAENTTFYAAYKLMIERLYARIPSARFIIMGMPYHQTADSTYDLTGDYQLRRDAIKNIAYHYGFPYIDLRKECGWNALNYSTYLQDTVHPNAAGAKRMAEVIIGVLKSITEL